MTIETHSLTPVDAAWLNMETPTNLMMVTGVLEFAEQVDFERLRQVYASRLLVFDRFRDRVANAALPFLGPWWEPDPYFDIDAHLHRVALAKPRSKKALLAMIGDLASTPLDMSKPLWQVHVIEGYRNRSVLVLRFHHCIADGVAMIAVVRSLMDSGPDADIEAPATQLEQPSGSPFTQVLDRLTASYETSRHFVDALAHHAAEQAMHPSRVVRAVGMAAVGLSVVGKALLRPADPASPLKGELGVRKRIALSPRVSLQAVKETAKRLDAKINDVLLAALCGSLRGYLRSREHPVDDLVCHVVVPVNLRPGERALELGNEFGLAYAPLDLSIGDPIERLRAVKRDMDRIKLSAEPLVFFGLLGLFGLGPKVVEQQALAWFGSKATAVMTNVAGPRETLYMAGSPVRNMMFWVPQSGQLGLGVSVLSYAGNVTLGVISDAGLVDDPGQIAKRFASEVGKIESRSLEMAAGMQA